MNQVAVHSTGKMDAPSIYSSEVAFESAQRIAKALSSSEMVPQSYRGNIANTLVAMEMANRTGSSVLMVTFPLYLSTNSVGVRKSLPPSADIIPVPPHQLDLPRMILVVLRLLLLHL